jgi:hypothetical protein
MVALEAANRKGDETMYDRRAILGGLVLALALPSASRAHHGWTWAEGETFELTGVIQSARLGNPHGILKVMAKGEEWTVEVGQPWRNERAGLKDSMLVKNRQADRGGNQHGDQKSRDQ